jgi:hypothetical protein
VAGDEALLSVVPATVIDRLSGRADGHGEVPRRLARPVLGYVLRRMERELRIQREELVARDQYLAESLAFAARQT